MTPPEPETPLSSAERQRLEQLERQLVVQFPDLDDAMRGGRRRHRFVPKPELALAGVVAVGLLVAAILLGGLGVAAAELLAMCVTALLVFGVPALMRRRAQPAAPGATPSTGSPATPPT
ncbi:MAG: DUF3040 domain-containing protein [Pseudonocardia sp.]|uniref:DUF3040 domain-containing protein n=1 Tax=unclassified Pseudonocardia TaxID=2619320 RepID=UPI00086BD291|nr:MULTISPECIES: DUF3040 domain-containing protein [unclassified Pseudonocardia]MBN9111299.1 DUF3040 domain-containing protein [Pseudonocardia sp.]ODU24554.1 MAG: hypothetical protein ABS80_12150 [Pseudonocardia sp. SCN 72-51]ODV06261.1 MAG: hypothetical protein ABT15_13390 [Pseudonocardia sp. SCN 73-27]